MLYVAKRNAFVTVGISGVDDEKVAPDKAGRRSQNSGEAVGDGTGFRTSLWSPTSTVLSFPAARTSRSSARATPTSRRWRFTATRSGLPLIEEEKDGCIFQFGPNRLWIDRVPNLSHPDIWLELETNDTEAAASYLKINGVPRRDEVEQLREDFDGFWISDPAGVIHLVVGDEE